MTFIQLAQENESRLQDFHQEVSQKTDFNNIIEQFIQQIKTNGRVSINVELKILIEILVLGEYLNIFEKSIREQEVFNHYQNFSEKLSTFSQLFPEVRNAKYGALNLGNMGTNYPKYGGGKWCIYLKKDFVDDLDYQHKVFALADYSLSYFNEEGNLSEKFRQEICQYRMVHFLALKKHYPQVIQGVESLPNLLINNQPEGSKLIEILLISKIFVKNFEKICVKERLKNHYKKLNNSKLALISLQDSLFLEQYEFVQTFCERSDIEFKSI